MAKTPVLKATNRAPSLSRIPDFEKHLLIDDHELSYLTGIPLGTLSQWRYSGKGPTPVKMEGCVRYYLSEVLKYIEECRQPSVRASMEGMHVAQAKR